MLIASLHPCSTILIPGILYSFYRRTHQDSANNEKEEVTGQSGFQFFQYFSEIDQYTIDILNQLDQELQHVKKALDAYFKGHVDFSCFLSLEEYLSTAYHQQIEDHSTLLSIFRTNSAFRNLEIPYLTIKCEEIPTEQKSPSSSSSSSRFIQKVVDSPLLRKRVRPANSSATSAPVAVAPPPSVPAAALPSNNAFFAIPPSVQENSPGTSSGNERGTEKRGGGGSTEATQEDEGRTNERLLRQFRNELAHGLMVAKAVADLVGVEVPGMVRILQAAQEDPLRMRILAEDAQLIGPDLGLSGCPQRFGICSPSELIV